MSSRPVNICRRACRRAGLDRNPLRRGEDRVQTAVAAFCALIFATLVPVLALTVGAQVYRTETAAVQVERARLRQVEATVVETGKTPLYAPIMPARVSWKDAAGATHTGDYQSTTVVEPGATVSIWLNDSGTVVEPPSASQAASKAVLCTGGAALGLLAGLAGFYLLLRRLLDHRRLHRWESEWLAADLSWGGHG